MENVQEKNCIALEELKQLMRDFNKDVKIVDVRSMEEFKLQHIPSALHLEISKLDLANLLFDKDDTVITVCGKGGGRSAEAATKLQQMGFKNANWLCGGTFGWKE
jgi:rhodanese-related sulfurtransferase